MEVINIQKVCSLILILINKDNFFLLTENLFILFALFAFWKIKIIISIKDYKYIIV